VQENIKQNNQEIELQIPILFEDDDIVVINKPGNIVTNAAASVKEPALQDWFQKYNKNAWPTNWASCLPDEFSDEYGTPEEIYAERKGMVHRLDKNTSGVMVFAKHPGSLINLLTQFRERKTHKEYLALVHGVFRVPHAIINAPLARARVDRRKFAVDIMGRPAETEYQVEKEFMGFVTEKVTELSPELQKELKQAMRLYNQGFALVRCWPRTGRTHQIRVHLAHEQHPLAGDVTYVGKKRAKFDSKWCERQFLHAVSLEFLHPRTNEQLRFEAPLPVDLQKTLDLLKIR